MAGELERDVRRRDRRWPAGRGEDPLTSVREFRLPDGRSLRARRLERPFAWEPGTVETEFALLLVILADDVTPEEQTALSEWLVRAGCRYAVCYGETSSSWDDSIDMVSVLDEVDGRSGPFVMTTWHDDEPLEDAVEFFAANTSFEDWTPPSFVVLMLGGDAESEQRVVNEVCRSFRIESE